MVHPLHKITVAIDSFKGSICSSAIAECIESEIRSCDPSVEVVKISMADGGEGTLDALARNLQVEYRMVEVHDPLMRPRMARLGLAEGGRVAIVELAEASGLCLVSNEEADPEKTTTFGTGELMAEALRLGCRKILLGIGGSATNDAATGILSPLGYRFLDCEGAALEPVGGNLSKIAEIESSGRNPLLEGCEIVIACDVDNPFFGERGAAAVYAPQKGASPEAVARLDDGLRHFADIISLHSGVDVNSVAGAGAAGGCGGGLHSLLGARLCNGAEFLLDAVDFDSKAAGSDLILTGEGRIDRQTLMGKAPSAVLRRAKALGIPCAAICGLSLIGPEEGGFDAIWPIKPLEMSVEESMKLANAEVGIRTITRKFIIN